MSEPQGLHSYGSEAVAVAALPGADRELGAGLTEAMVRFAARSEYARTVEDVLARRCRLLFLDAALAGSLASAVGSLLRAETGVDPQVKAFKELARLYLTMPI
jgi:glycerol-3-phosphate dehydrogenase